MPPRSRRYRGPGRARLRLVGESPGARGGRRTAPFGLLLLAAVAVGGAGGYALFDVSWPTGGPRTVVARAALSESALVGRASVIDGDTLEIGGRRIRLHGIDAPESGQHCTAGGTTFRCGQQAAVALDQKIATQTVRCDPRDRDRYDRIVAVCTVDGTDLGAWMVAHGWALAYRQYSRAYIEQEAAATAAKVGVWQGDFVAPWDWRRGSRLQPQSTQTSAECLIKGNISSRGERIYHVPGAEYYDRTRIDAGKGERWFCSEAEARAAGWRRSRR